MPSESERPIDETKPPSRFEGLAWRPALEVILPTLAVSALSLWFGLWVQGLLLPASIGLAIWLDPAWVSAEY